MPPRYCSHLIITAHAHSRWRIRAPGMIEPSAAHLMRKLNGMLRGGVTLDDRCQMWIPVNARMSAICMPLTGIEGGGWMCMTYKYNKAWERYNRCTI